MNKKPIPRIEAKLNKILKLIGEIEDIHAPDLTYEQITNIRSTLYAHVFRLTKTLENPRTTEFKLRR